jgi:hypothetical protein
MTSLAILQPLLAVVAALFVLMSTALLIDRFVYDRRSRRVAALHRRLTIPKAAARPEPADEGAWQLSPSEFHQLALAGLPGETEARLARELRARHHVRHGGADIDASGGSVWDRMVALHLLVASAGSSLATYAALDDALRSGEPMLAGAAMRLLIRLNEYQGAARLVQALEDGAGSRARLAAALDRLTVPRWDLLQRLLRHRDAQVRAWGARLAGRHGTQALAADLRTLATDTDGLVRRAAVEALGVLADPCDRALIRSRFRDAVPMVRAHAARAAAGFADAEMAGALTDLLADREWIVRAASREALQRMGAVAQSSLVRALWHHDPFAANSAAEVLHRTGAITAIARCVIETPLLASQAAETLSRYAEVAGPHLCQALLAAFDGTDAARMLVYLQPHGWEPVPARVGRRA